LLRNQLGMETSCSKEDIEVEMTTPDLGIIIPEVCISLEGVNKKMKY